MNNRTPTCGIHAFHRDEGGQMGFLGVLSAAALACLLFYVINTGYATSEKIGLQNAADASVLSGAMWNARALNLVSLNNVTQTQLLAVAIILVALDKTLDLVKGTILPAMITAAKACAATGWGAPICGPLLIKLYQEQYEANFLSVIVKPMRQAFVGTNRDGMLWQAMKLLSRLSQGIAGGFPVLAELAAYRTGVRNGAKWAVIFPYPSLPVRRGTFNDLCDPTLHGSPEEASRGYEPLLGYWRNWGPLKKYGGYVEALLAGTMTLSGAWIIFPAMGYAEYESLCGDSGEETSYESPKYFQTLAECRAGGGGMAEYARNCCKTCTTAFNACGDTCIAKSETCHVGRGCACNSGETTGKGTIQQSCSMPPPNGYTFVIAKGRATEEAGVTAQPPTEQDQPFPMLLGKRADDTTPMTKEKLELFGLAYREREALVAPAVFESPYGRHRFGYAQARVYNRTAFDLFTQNWRVKLVPATMLENGNTAGLGSGEFKEVPGGADAAPFANGLGQLGDLMRSFNNH